MQLRDALRAAREPGEALLGWALLLPTGRAIVVGSAFMVGAAVPVLLPFSALVFAWAQGSGRRLGLLTDRRLILIRASRGRPRIESCVPVSGVLVRGGAEPGDPVRVRFERPDGTCASFRPAFNGLERRFVAGLHAVSGAGSSGAVC